MDAKDDAQRLTEAARDLQDRLGKSGAIYDAHIVAALQEKLQQALGNQKKEREHSEAASRFSFGRKDALVRMTGICCHGSKKRKGAVGKIVRLTDAGDWEVQFNDGEMHYICENGMDPLAPGKE